MDKFSKILVTGAFGFLGNYVCEELWARGYLNVIRCGNTKELWKVPVYDENYKTIYGNLCDPQHVEAILKETEPNVVIHLAATVGGIAANKRAPAEFIYNNLKMGIELIEHCRHRPDIEKFVLASTVCSYPKYATVPFQEEFIWDGFPEETNAPYGIAKKTLMLMLETYREQYGFNGITLIPVNLYGPGDNFDGITSHVIPALIKQIAETGPDGPLTVWGTGHASREFLHARDAADGIVDATEKYSERGPVNLGTGRETQIRELVVMLRKIMGHTGPVEYDVTKPDGQPSRCLDISRAEKFGFKAKISLEDGLQETVNWWNACVEADTVC